MIRRPPRSPLFPYTPLSGSQLSGFVIAVLHGRRLHEVRARRLERSADAAVKGELGAAHGVDHDARRVGGIHDLELEQIGRAHSELQSPCNLVCRLLLEKKKT